MGMPGIPNLGPLMELMDRTASALERVADANERMAKAAELQAENLAGLYGVKI